MTEYKVRLGPFDVEIDDDSHIDAAFAGAEWLKRRAQQGRFDALVYETQKHGETEWFETDLEEVVALSYDVDNTERLDQTQTLPEDNSRTHELFDAFKQILAEMKAHRPDDLVAAWHVLASEIEATQFPELIFDEETGVLTCPYCEDTIEREDPDDDLYWLDDFGFYDWDTSRYSAELIQTDTGAWQISAVNDEAVEWQSLYAQHGCGGAVSIPANIHIEFS